MTELYEKRIIGGIVTGLVAPSAVDLDASDFTDPELGAVLAIARDLERSSLPIDPAVVADRLGEKDLGWLSARDFALMGESARSAALVYEAVNKVKASALKSFLLESARQIAAMEDRQASVLFDAFRDATRKAERHYRTSENSFVFLAELAPQVRAVYDDFLAGRSYAVPTGFASVDNLLLDGFSKGDLHLIVGMTGAGKSALALNYALNQARAGIVTGIVSREMSDIENVMRLQARDAVVPRWQIRRDMFVQTHRSLVENLETIAALPIAIDTRSETVEQLAGSVREMTDRHAMGILYVDYLQLLSSDKSNETRANEVQHISRELKKLAMETEIPIVALAQFNNGVSQASVFDVMNHIRESGSIKQDASTIQYIQLEHTEVPVEQKAAKLTVLKNRNGETFTPIELVYRGALFTFREAYR